MKKIFVALLLLCSFSITVATSYAQLGTAGCPETSEDPCQAIPWHQDTETVTIGVDCIVEVVFEYKVCPDGSVNYRILSVTPISGCKAFSISTMIELTQIELIREQAASGGTLENFIADCDEETQLVQFYNSACWYWQTCTFEIDTNQPDGDCTPANPPQTIQGATIEKSYLVSCGQACCATTLSVCKTEDPFAEDSITLTISYIDRSRVGPACEENGVTCQDSCE